MMRSGAPRRTGDHSTRLARVFALGAIAAIALSGCGWFAQELAPDTATAAASVFYKDLDEYNMSRPIRYAVDLGETPRELYLVFTNPTSGELEPPALDVLSVAGAQPDPSLFSSAGPLGSDLARGADEQIGEGPQGIRDNPEILDWEPSPGVPRAAGQIVPQPNQYVAAAPGPGEYTIGSEFDFYDANYDPVTATLAARNDGISTAHGTKAVEIWVASSEYSGGNPSLPAVNDDPFDPYDVTTGMAQDLADAFLTTGDPNDIYDWVSEIYGPEWSATGEPRYTVDGYTMIDGYDTITILLYPITIYDDDAGPGGVVGFFWAKDNFDAVSGTNRRVMFYIDSESYGYRAGGTWEIEDPWPNDMVSTLAHEFQHMIHFHVRAAAQGASTATWMNEMMSLMAEDFVERKRQLPGPRGVDPSDDGDSGTAGTDGNPYGRLPLYNAANTVGLLDWGGSGDTLESYSAAYAFGAFLGRNYGGARLFEELAASGSSSSDTMLQEATLAATGGQAGVGLEQLLMQWGAAVILSDRAGLDPASRIRMNANGWITSSTSDGYDYDLGSINHFLYDPEPAPTLATGLPAVSVTALPAVSKVMYRVGTGLSGVIELEITAVPGTDFAVVVK